MQTDELTDAQRDLLKIIACSIRNERFCDDKETDYGNLIKESREQTVTLQAFDAINPSNIDNSEQKNNWLKLSYRLLKKNIEVYQEHQYIHKLMSDNNIKYVILKGIATAKYYPKPIVRTMGDVDFLVSAEDFLRAVDIMKNDNFTLFEENSPHHYGFRKGKFLAEMHFKVPGMPDGKPGRIIEDYFNDLFEKAEEVTVEGITFFKPSDFHHGLILLMHMYHHLLSTGIGLRHLCDWAVFINSFDSDKFESLFSEKLRACGLWRYTQIMSLVAQTAFELPYKKWMGKADEELIDAILHDIFCGGNFGRKDRNRFYEGVMISNGGKNGVGGNKFIRIITTMQSVAKTSFPKLSKIPVLKYFAFIPLGIRRIYRIIKGKRSKINIKKALSGAEKRGALYREFHLFELEKDDIE